MSTWAIAAATAHAQPVASPADAPREPACIEAVRWSGDAELLSATRAALSAGALAALPGSRCDGVEVHVERAGSGAARVTVRRAEQVVRYASHDPASLPSWIESWLLPDAESPSSVPRAVDPAPPVALAASEPAGSAAPPELDAEPATTEPTPTRDAGPDEDVLDAEGRAGAARVAAERAGSETDVPSRSSGVPLLGTLRLGGDLDPVAPAWTTGELELAIGIGSAVWVSLAATAAWSPEQDDTERLAIRVAGRAGYRHRFTSGLLRLGIGAGIVSASARREYDTAEGQVVRTDEEAGPFAEVYTGFEIAVGGSIALSIACVLRGHVPDDAFDEGDAPGELRMPLADPIPLPVIAATLQVGIAYGLGDAW